MSSNNYSGQESFSLVSSSTRVEADDDDENHGNDDSNHNDDDDELSEGEEVLIRELSSLKDDSMKKAADDNDTTLSEGEEDIIDELTASEKKRAKTAESSSSSSSFESSSLICPFVPGDHVYQWHKVVGVPFYHHHGIVLKSYWDNEQHAWMLHVSDFSNISLREAILEKTKGNTVEDVTTNTNFHSRSSSINPFHKEAPGTWRTYVSPAVGWKKVVYEANLWEKMKNPSMGTSTSNGCDPPNLVLARAMFLQEHSATVLDMPYNWVENNCETAAVWCKTGKWTTLQALCAVVAGSAATTQITTVAAVVTTAGMVNPATVSVIVATQPYIIPIVAATYGMISVGIPAVTMYRTKRKWKVTTNKLNSLFGKDTANRQEKDVSHVEMTDYVTLSRFSLPSIN